MIANILGGRRYRNPTKEIAEAYERNEYLKESARRQLADVESRIKIIEAEVGLLNIREQRKHHNGGHA